LVDIKLKTSSENIINVQMVWVIPDRSSDEA